MPKIEVFDPPMCCNTGVCGPEPAEHLSQFSADLDWLARSGAEVSRFNLAHDPLAFTNHPRVRELLQQSAGEALPVIVVDGSVVSQGEYPSRDRLAGWAGLPSPAPAKPGLSIAAEGGCCGGECC